MCTQDEYENETAHLVQNTCESCGGQTKYLDQIQSAKSVVERGAGRGVLKLLS